METCTRGFSFMSESKVDLVDLQYIEGGELERAWRSNRRERMKQREQKIWDNFVKEQDIVKGVCKDDQYQFLDQLPESCLKEIMAKELQKMTQESAEEDKAKELVQQGNGDNSSLDDGQHTCVVTFADDIDKEDCEMFHIFDDEQSGAEEDVPNDPESPPTVRERQADSTNHSPERLISLEKSPSKSSENVSNAIESSIYCAKVKDLRAKINEELIALMTSLDRRDILSAEPEDVARMVKRSAEFCARFNRIYMYQLQRQIHDIKRNNSMSLPFAKHTQFQSQMVRIVSLHQSLLQSFQVLHKSLAQTCMVRESAAALGALLAAAREGTDMCLSVPPPKDFSAALDLYKDDMLATCDKVDDLGVEYAMKCEELLNSFENKNVASSRKVMKNTGKKRSFGVWNRKPATDAEARLSMYSLDTSSLRLNLHPKSSSSKEMHTGSSKMHGSNVNSANKKRGQRDKNAEPTPTHRRSCRPLMRDPHAGRPRAPRPTRDTDIRTMVEGVETCASSHISPEGSPTFGRSSKPASPRHDELVPPMPQVPFTLQPPQMSHPSQMSHSPDTSRSPNSSRSPNTSHSPHPSHAQQGHSPRFRNPHEPLHKKKQQSPTRAKRLKEPSLSKAPKPHLVNPTRIDQETVDPMQMMPVLKIQCAMKKDLEVDNTTKHRATNTRVQEDSNEKKKNTTDMKQGHKTQGPVKIKADGVAKYGDYNKTDSTPRKTLSPVQIKETVEKNERERSKMSTLDRCEVTRLLKQLCSGDASGGDRITGAKNAQLLYVNGSSLRQPSTPQLLKILEETIQKKIPRPLFQKSTSVFGPDRYRLLFNIAEKTSEALFQYRTKFVQHMLTSSMYANSAVGKPWEMIGSVSEEIINEVLLSCIKDIELRNVIQELYKNEAC